MVSDLPLEPPVFVGVAATVRDAAVLMKKRAVDLLTVVTEAGLLGTLSDYDIVSRVAATARDPTQTAVCDVMTIGFGSVKTQRYLRPVSRYDGPSAPLSQLVFDGSGRRIRGALGRPDLATTLRLAADDSGFSGANLEIADLSAPLSAIPSSWTIAKTARKMVDEGARQLAVSRGARLLGIVGLDEIIRDVVAKGISSSEIRAAEAATTRFAFIEARCTPAQAAGAAESSHARYLVLLGPEERPVGLLAAQRHHRVRNP